MLWTVSRELDERLELFSVRLLYYVARIEDRALDLVRDSHAGLQLGIAVPDRIVVHVQHLLDF